MGDTERQKDGPAEGGQRVGDTAAGNRQPDDYEPGDRRPGTPTVNTDERVAALERVVAAMAEEVRTRRLVLMDWNGAERLVADVDRGTVELRLDVVPTPDDGPSAASAVLYATGPTGSRAGNVGPSVGLQLWAQGDAVVEVDAWPDEAGQWHPHLHVGD